MAKIKLLPGFRFHPTPVELVVYFLKRKMMGKKLCDGVIAELDIYKYAPWDLPEMSCLRTGELEWYFFCQREKKYGSGSRMKRATEKNGYWKSTGNDRAVRHNNQTVGMIKTLIFHTGKSPHGQRTNWVMHEHRLEDKDLADKGIAQDSYVVCKVFQKEGPGPRNGALYGRPFNEDDWDEEELGMPCAASSSQVPILPKISDGSVPNDNDPPASGCIGVASSSCLSGSMPSPGTGNPSDPYDQAVNNDDDDIERLLENVRDDNLFEVYLFTPPMQLDENITEGAPLGDFFEGLEDYLAVFSSGQNIEFSPNKMATSGDAGSSDNLYFLELTDLDSP
ncbi:hypothetical protein Fmac_004206 [Flemingia macrophylla]|uniref:NAC domain-containing protein n=1 Tax=Flemingia macrophylla TaxID=520843 RepID=A0ABD1N4D3_9FABA